MVSVAQTMQPSFSTLKVTLLGRIVGIEPFHVLLGVKQTVLTMARPFYTTRSGNMAFGVLEVLIDGNFAIHSLAIASG